MLINSNRLFLIVFIAGITLSPGSSAVETDELDLRLTLATPGHHDKAHQSNVESSVAQQEVQSNADKPSEADQFQDIAPKSLKRKKRTKVEMAVSRST